MLLPQLYKSITTKSVDDLSIFFLYLLLIGTILRLYYSYTIKAWPIIISNIFPTEPKMVPRSSKKFTIGLITLL